MTLLTEGTAVSTTNHVTKEKLGTLNVLHAGPTSARNILTNFSPNPARSEKPGLTYNSAPCQKFHSKSSTCITTRKHTVF